MDSCFIVDMNHGCFLMINTWPSRLNCEMETRIRESETKTCESETKDESKTICMIRKLKPVNRKPKPVNRKPKKVHQKPKSLLQKLTYRNEKTGWKLECNLLPRSETVRLKGWLALGSSFETRIKWKEYSTSNQRNGQRGWQIWSLVKINWCQ